MNGVGPEVGKSRKRPPSLQEQGRSNVLFPLNVDVPMSRLPVANWILIGLISLTTFLGWANTDLLLAMAGVEYQEAPNTLSLDDLRQMDEEEIQAALEEASASELLQFGPEPVFNPPWWKLPILAISSSLLHADPIHLIGNMLFLLFLGTALEEREGRDVVLIIYLVGGVVAGLAHILLHLDSYHVLIGASGAIPFARRPRILPSNFPILPF